MRSHIEQRIRLVRCPKVGRCLLVMSHLRHEARLPCAIYLGLRAMIEREEMAANPHLPAMQGSSQKSFREVGIPDDVEEIATCIASAHHCA